jgi:hypothetical protein
LLRLPVLYEDKADLWKLKIEHGREFERIILWKARAEDQNFGRFSCKSVKEFLRPPQQHGGWQYLD